MKCRTVSLAPACPPDGNTSAWPEVAADLPARQAGYRNVAVMAPTGLGVCVEGPLDAPTASRPARAAVYAALTSWRRPDPTVGLEDVARLVSAAQQLPDPASRIRALTQVAKVMPSQAIAGAKRLLASAARINDARRAGELRTIAAAEAELGFLEAAASRTDVSDEECVQVAIVRGSIRRGALQRAQEAAERIREPHLRFSALAAIDDVFSNTGRDATLIREGMRAAWGRIDPARRSQLIVELAGDPHLDVAGLLEVGGVHGPSLLDKLKLAKPEVLFAPGVSALMKVFESTRHPSTDALLSRVGRALVEAKRFEESFAIFSRMGDTWERVDGLLALAEAQRREGQDPEPALRSAEMTEAAPALAAVAVALDRARLNAAPTLARAVEMARTPNNHLAWGLVAGAQVELGRDAGAAYANAESAAASIGSPDSLATGLRGIHQRQLQAGHLRAALETITRLTAATETGGVRHLLAEALTQTAAETRRPELFRRAMEAIDQSRPELRLGLLVEAAMGQIRAGLFEEAAVTMRAACVAIAPAAAPTSGSTETRGILAGFDLARASKERRRQLGVALTTFARSMVQAERWDLAVEIARELPKPSWRAEELAAVAEARIARRLDAATILDEADQVAATAEQPGARFGLMMRIALARAAGSKLGRQQMKLGRR